MFHNENAKCLNCGKDFFAQPSELKRGGGKYCCHQCSVEYRKKTHVSVNVPKKCETCGKEFLIKPSLASTARFCSLPCKHKGHSLEMRKHGEVGCKICGKVFYPTHKGQKYCSSACNGIADQKRISSKCSFCGEPLEIKLFQWRKKNFCSADCLISWRQKSMLGNQNLLGYTHTVEAKERQREAMLEKFDDPEYWKIWGKRITKSSIEHFVDDNTPPLILYTGDGKHFYTFKDGRHKNPDFYVQGSNRVIELFGSYWHRGEYPEELIAKYAEIGIVCLVMWEEEIISSPQEALQKIMAFAARAHI